MPTESSTPVGAPAPRPGARTGIMMIVILASGALLGACGSSKKSTSTPKTNLDTARVARSIEQSIFAQRHLKASVVCPTGIPQEARRTFECVATTPQPKNPKKLVKTPFVVTIQNSKGYVTYV